MGRDDRSLNLKDYNYLLPKELIAQEPCLIRDECRLLVLDRRTGKKYHKYFFELPEYLKAGDVLVLNDARVMPWRIYGKTRENKSIEALLLKQINSHTWEALIKPSKKLKDGAEILWEDELRSIVKKEKDSWIITFEDRKDIPSVLERIGHAPLPPYIKRKMDHPLNKIDRIMYQTIFNRAHGAVAAPTASLHFTERLLAEIRTLGVHICLITLLVGRGSFEPIRTEKITEHRMGIEFFDIKEDVAQIINSAKNRGNKILAVGTTVVRALESSALKTKKVTSGSGYTDLFIYPGFNFNVVDALITNFHLPRSSPLILTSAFAGREKLLRAYEYAKKMGYRFLSYGDAMLIL